MFGFGSKNRIAELENELKKQQELEAELRCEIGTLEEQLNDCQNSRNALLAEVEERKLQCLALGDQIEKERVDYAAIAKQLKFNESTAQCEALQIRMDNEFLLRENESLKDLLRLTDEQHKQDAADLRRQYQLSQVKYQILIRELGIKTFGDLEYKKNKREISELIEVFIEEEYEKEKLRLQLCDLLRQIIESFGCGFADETETSPIKSGTNRYGINSNAHCGTLGPPVLQCLSRYYIVKRYIQWAGEQCNERAALHILDNALIKYGWVDNDPSSYVSLINSGSDVASKTRGATWEKIELIDSVWLKLYFSVEDIILMFCRYYKNDSILGENIEKLKSTLEIMGFKIQLISEKVLIQKINSALKRVHKDDSETNHNSVEHLTRQQSKGETRTNSIGNSTGKQTVNRTGLHPSPQYSYCGTEFVSGHYRRRNGKIEWVSPHTRRRK